jgi:hypothetical protein
MKTMTRNLLIKALALAATLAAGGAQAQLFRSYLSLNGSDANPCTLQAPCRLLPAALNAVADGGEVWMLNSANYNTSTVEVTKSVTILAIPGAVGSVVSTGGTSAVNIATAGVNVVLRNLMVAPIATSPGPDGVVMTAGSKLTLENCVLARYTGRAVSVVTAAAVKVVDSLFRDNAFGVYLAGGAKAEVIRSTFAGSDNGVHLQGEVPSTVTTAAVSESTFSGGGFGVAALANAATAEVQASVARSTVTGNSTGFAVTAAAGAGPASLTISRNFVGGNGQFFQQAGSTAFMRTLGDNHVDPTNSTGTLTPVLKR